MTSIGELRTDFIIIRIRRPLIMERAMRAVDSDLLADLLPRRFK